MPSSATAPDLMVLAVAPVQRLGGTRMRGTDHLRSRYEVGGVLLSSAGRGWRGISAELRSHSVGEIPGYEPSLTEIGVLIRGTTVVTRQGGGVQQRIDGHPGTIGLVPVG